MIYFWNRFENKPSLIHDVISNTTATNKITVLKSIFKQIVILSFSAHKKWFRMHKMSFPPSQVEIWCKCHSLSFIKTTVFLCCMFIYCLKVYFRPSRSKVHMVEELHLIYDKLHVWYVEKFCLLSFYQYNLAKWNAWKWAQLTGISRWDCVRSHTFVISLSLIWWNLSWLRLRVSDTVFMLLFAPFLITRRFDNSAKDP